MDKKLREVEVYQQLIEGDLFLIIYSRIEGSMPEFISFETKEERDTEYQSIIDGGNIIISYDYTGEHRAIRPYIIRKADIVDRHRLIKKIEEV